MLQCVVLAGGLGTRLRPRTEAVPKSLIEVAGTPFASWQLGWLFEQGVRRVVYSIGHLGHLVSDYVGNGSAWGLDVAYVRDQPTLAGTAGALRLAAGQGALDDHFFVLYGDSYLTVTLADVAARFLADPAPALMTVFRNAGQWDRSNVIVAAGRVARYDKACDEPPPAMQYIDYGLSVLSRHLIEELVTPGQPADLAPVLSELSRRGDLAAYEVTERFYEIGSPEGLRDLEQRLSEGSPTTQGH